MLRPAGGKAEDDVGGSLSRGVGVHVSNSLLGRRNEGGDFDFDFGALIDEAVDLEQRRWREIPSQRLLPGRADAGASSLVLALAGQIPGQAHDVLGAGAGLAEQLDDPLQRLSNLGGKVRRVVALLVAAGLAGQHHPFAGSIDHDTVRKAARFRPFGRLQDTHLLASSQELTASLAPIRSMIPQRN
jgi:hypothetical protein